MNTWYNPYSDKLLNKLEPKAIFIGIEEGKEEVNTAFTNGIQFAWDSTSINLFKTCPRKYYWTIVKGYVPKIMPPPLAFGIHLHTLLQTWHQLVESGIDKHTALIRVTKLAGLLGETLPPGDTARTKETLTRSVVWYLDQFWNDKAITVKRSDGRPAVEYHFQLPFMSYKGQTVFICGHLDRLVQWQGQTYVSDYKTTKYSLDGRFFDQFKPSVQMALYATACHLISDTTSDLPSAHGVIIDGIQLGVNFTRFARQIVQYSLEEINEYIENLQHWIRQAMNACETGIFPPNETACNQYSGCHFRDICAMPPARREVFLEGNFKKRTWDPLKRRD
jgi:hypothetical protein